MTNYLLASTEQVGTNIHAVYGSSPNPKEMSTERAHTNSVRWTASGLRWRVQVWKAWQLYSRSSLIDFSSTVLGKRDMSPHASKNDLFSPKSHIFLKAISEDLGYQAFQLVSRGPESHTSNETLN